MLFLFYLLGSSLKFLLESGQAAKRRFEETDANLHHRLKENADEQEELRMKLAELQRREKKLEEEKETRRGIQRVAEEVPTDKMQYNSWFYVKMIIVKTISNTVTIQSLIFASNSADL